MANPVTSDPPLLQVVGILERMSSVNLLHFASERLLTLAPAIPFQGIARCCAREERAGAVEDEIQSAQVVFLR